MTPRCCSKCGNYKFREYHPRRIQCWNSVTGDCYRDPNKATVSQMKTRVISVRNWDIERECAICLRDVEVGRFVKKIFCGHAFHTNCLKKWTDLENRTCPLCRFDFTSKQDLLDNLHNAVDEFNTTFSIWRNDGHSEESFSILSIKYEIVTGLQQRLRLVSVARVRRLVVMYDMALATMLQRLNL